MFLVKDLLIDWRLGEKVSCCPLSRSCYPNRCNYSTSTNICLMLTSRLIMEGGNGVPVQVNRPPPSFYFLQRYNHIGVDPQPYFRIFNPTLQSVKVI